MGQGERNVKLNEVLLVVLVLLNVFKLALDLYDRMRKRQRKRKQHHSALRGPISLPESSELIRKNPDFPGVSRKRMQETTGLANGKIQP
jgi:hypothetical protein